MTVGSESGLFAKILLRRTGIIVLGSPSGSDTSNGFSLDLDDPNPTVLVRRVLDFSLDLSSSEFRPSREFFVVLVRGNVEDDGAFSKGAAATVIGLFETLAGCLVPRRRLTTEGGRSL